MRILMLGNSLTFANDMPRMLAELTGAEVVHHTRSGARLSEQLNPKTKLGARTKAVLTQEHWDYVVLQEMSHGPVSSPERFLSSVEQLCALIRANGALPVLYATWGYQRGSAALAAKDWDYDDMARGLADAYRKAAENNHALLAEVGGRFYELSDAQNLYAADGVHPNEQGSRLAAEILAAVIQQQEEKKRLREDTR
ncbi:MAG TPA: SGNH/GDSL hydrolase family protein [Candidatus Agathobaculum merdigallinarum]|nr:SGNH/GDSL hydrolase family protein [Candidatus Agathobaculum merdigallinarum]